MKKSKLARKRVKRGVKLLRKHDKEWASDVNTKSLDMSCVAMCLLGQVFGNYGNGVGELGVDLAPERYGFDRSERVGYKRLNKLWKAVVKKERKKTAA